MESDNTAAAGAPVSLTTIFSNYAARNPRNILFEITTFSFGMLVVMLYTSTLSNWWILLPALAWGTAYCFYADSILDDSPIEEATS